MSQGSHPHGQRRDKEGSRRNCGSQPVQDLCPLMDTGEEGQESPWVLNNSTDGDSTSSPGKLCQHLITLTIEEASILFRWNLLCAHRLWSCHWTLLRTVPLLPLRCLPSGMDNYNMDKVPLSLLSSKLNSPSFSAFPHKRGALA